MINEIFTQMKWYGWNLGDNNNEDFEEVYKRHYKNLIKWFDYIVDSNYDFDMKNINKIEFEQFVDFISDFLRAFNEINNKKSKEDKIREYILSRNIQYDLVGEDLLEILNEE